MHSILGKFWRTGIIGNLLTGMFVLLPFMLTVLIISWVISTVGATIGPGTWIGDLLTSGGAAIVGQKRGLIAFLIGACIALASLWLLGLIVRIEARRALDRTLDDVLATVPLFRSIYRPVSQVVRLFAASKADLAGLPVVMCRLGGDQGADVPALLAANEVFDVGGDRRLLVYLPTSPLPAWGGLVLVPEAAVIRVPSMDADALIKLYFSFGVLAREVIPTVARS
ncbi:putative membrane protein [Bradyrhizobium sp. AZCC 1610]